MFRILVVCMVESLVFLGMMVIFCFVVIVLRIFMSSDMVFVGSLIGFICLEFVI